MRSQRVHSAEQPPLVRTQDRMGWLEGFYNKSLFSAKTFPTSSGSADASQTHSHSFFIFFFNFLGIATPRYLDCHHCVAPSRQIRREPVNNSVPQWLGSRVRLVLDGGPRIFMSRCCDGRQAVRLQRIERMRIPHLLRHHLSNDLRGKNIWGGISFLDFVSGIELRQPECCVRNALTVERRKGKRVGIS